MVATKVGVELESETYHPASETHRFEYDRDATPASMAVVAALSEVTGSDPIELEPLHATVDADALEALTTVRHTPNGDVDVSFSIEGYRVTVHSYGVVAVAPLGRRRADRGGGGPDR